METLPELLLDVAYVGVVASVGIEVALRGGEDSASSVGFDAAAFEFEVKVILVFVVCQIWICLVEFVADLVIQSGLKLASPGIETEVEQEPGACRVFVIWDECYETVIACPGVVCGDSVVGDALQAFFVKVVAQETLNFLWLGGYDP